MKNSTVKRILLCSFIYIAVLLSGCSQPSSQIVTRIDLAGIGPDTGDVFSSGKESDVLPSPACTEGETQGADAPADTYSYATEEAKLATPTCSDVRISVVVQEHQNTYKAESGDEALFYQQLQESTVSIPSNRGAELAINSTLQENQEAEALESQEFLSIAEESYELVREDTMEGDFSFYGYSYYTSDTVYRLDSAVFSLATYCSSYTGGAHPNSNQYAMNFNVETGQQLSLADVLLPEGESSLESMVLDWLRVRADDYGLFDSEQYESVVAEKFAAGVLREQMSAWYFSDTGLVTFFNPYDIAAYAAGVIKIEFPYGELRGLLEPRFFPTRLGAGGGGSISTGFSRSVDLSAYETVEEVGSGSGPALSITAQSPVYDLSVSWINWVGNHPIVQSTVYIANVLSQQNLVLVNLDAKSDLENICIQYNPGNGTFVTAYLDPETGDIAIPDTHGK